MKKNDIISKTVIKEGQTLMLTGKVKWVVNDEAGVEYTLPVSYRNTADVIKISDGWKIEQVAAPSFQSSVEHMSEEELRLSIDKLRNSRATISKPKLTKSRVKAAPVSNDPMAKMLASMPPDKKAALMKKLGMTE